MLYSLAGHWAIGAPAGIYLCESRQLGVTGVWIGLALGACVTTLLTLHRLRGHHGRLQARARALPA